LVASAALAPPALAKQGDFLIRTRAIMVAPNDRSGGIMPTFAAEKVSVNNSIMPEIDFTYMMTENIGAELILATTKHDAKGRTGTTGSIGKLASTWVLPPTLTLQYHFSPDAAIRPYVGAGINYTVFYSEKASKGLEAAVGDTSVRMKSSFGYALQAGVDVPLSDRTFLNLDFKYIDIDTTARLATTAIGMQEARVHLDPIVLGIGIGMRF
jgi:outer membrane protein